MVQSVELLLDHTLETTVRRQWQALAAAALPHQGWHLGAANRPHITLVAADHLSAGTEAELVRRVGRPGTLPVTLRLGALLVFEHRRHVLARLAVPNRALLDLQQRLVETLDEPFPPHLSAGTWTPHVTLARGLSTAQLTAALTVLAERRSAAERDGAAVGIRRWDGERRVEWLIAGEAS